MEGPADKEGPAEAEGPAEVMEGPTEGPAEGKKEGAKETGPLGVFTFASLGVFTFASLGGLFAIARELVPLTEGFAHSHAASPLVIAQVPTVNPATAFPNRVHLPFV